MLVAMKLCASLAAAGKATALLSVASPVSAGPLYDNCTNFNEKYPHGVGRKDAKDKTSGTPVTTFKRSTKFYKKAMRENSRLDGDSDGIACEKA